MQGDSYLTDSNNNVSSCLWNFYIFILLILLLHIDLFLIRRSGFFSLRSLLFPLIFRLLMLMHSTFFYSHPQKLLYLHLLTLFFSVMVSLIEIIYLEKWAYNYIVHSKKNFRFTFNSYSKNTTIMKQSKHMYQICCLKLGVEYV